MQSSLFEFLGSNNWGGVSLCVLASDAKEASALKSVSDFCGFESFVLPDFRAQTGKQAFAATAPLNLVYVADLNKMTPASKESKIATANINCGFVAQNVYLYCASEGLGTVVRGYVDREKLAKTMQLSSNQVIIVAQTIGFPK